MLLAAFFLFATPDALVRTIVGQTPPCLSSYDCCVKNHPYDALDACGHPPGLSTRSGTTTSTAVPQASTTTATPAPSASTTTATPAPSSAATTGTPAPSTAAPSVTPSPSAGPGASRWIGPAVAAGAGAALKDSPFQQPQAAQAKKDSPEVEAAQRRKPPRPALVTIPDPNWAPMPGQPSDPPCFFTGSGGPGPSRPPDWIRCTYRCGKYQVEFFDIWGSSSEDCEKWVHLERAAKEAEAWARVHDKGR